MRSTRLKEAKAIMMIAVMLTAVLFAIPMQAAASAEVFYDVGNSVINSSPITTYHDISTIEQLNNELKNLEKILSSLEENSVTGSLTEQEITEIQASKNKLSALDVEIKKEFAETKKKLEEIGSLNASKRHEEVVAEYTTGMAAIQYRITSLGETKDRKDIKGRSKNLKENIQSFTYEPEYRPLSPKLPHRIAKPTEKKPYAGPGIVSAYHSSTAGIISPFEVKAMATAPTSDDLADTIDANQTQELRDLAAELDHHPVKIYEYVRNNIDYEPYYGSRKGSQETLWEMGGNDFDQASLLISLYRASGIPSRYVYGTIDIPIDKAMNWTGVRNESVVANVFASGGIPTTAIILPNGTITAIRIEHVWVEAYVPYTNYRGVPRSDKGKAWVPLDPSFKFYEYRKALDLQSILNVDIDDVYNQTSASAICDENGTYATGLNYSYVNQSMVKARDDLVEYIDNNMVDQPLVNLTGGRRIISQELGILPNTLQYNVLHVQSKFAEIPSNLRQQIILSIEDEYNNEILYYNSSLPEIAGRRITLSYQPAHQSDVDLINSSGGIFNVTSVYLLELCPVLRINGSIVAAGVSEVNAGSYQTFNIEITNPIISNTHVSNQLVAGQEIAIVLNLGHISTTELNNSKNNIQTVKTDVENNFEADADDLIGGTYYIDGLLYWAQVDTSNFILANQQDLFILRHPSEAIVGKNIYVGYLFGRPYQLYDGGEYIDVDTDLLTVVSKTGDKAQERNFMSLTGQSGSSLENAILEESFGVTSVSTIKILQEANAQGIPIYKINGTNIGSAINGLNVSTSLKNEISSVVTSGRIVIIPQTYLTIGSWSGMGYIISDPVTGAAAYIISGGIAGRTSVAICGGSTTAETSLTGIQQFLTYGAGILDDLIGAGIVKLNWFGGAGAGIATGLGALFYTAVAVIDGYDTWQRTDNLWASIGIFGVSLLVGFFADWCIMWVFSALFAATLAGTLPVWGSILLGIVGAVAIAAAAGWIVTTVKEWVINESESSSSYKAVLTSYAKKEDTLNILHEVY